MEKREVAAVGRISPAGTSCRSCSDRGGVIAWDLGTPLSLGMCVMRWSGDFFERWGPVHWASLGVGSRRTDARGRALPFIYFIVEGLTFGRPATRRVQT
jgi:hypothetical protein